MNISIRWVSATLTEVEVHSGGTSLYMGLLDDDERRRLVGTFEAAICRLTAHPQRASVPASEGPGK